MDSIQIATLIIFVCGAAVPVLCIIKMHLLNKYKRIAIVTTAIVTYAERRSAYRSGYYYVLSVQYTDQSGILYTAKAVTAKKTAPGDKIPLMYQSSDPANYRTDFGKGLPWLLGLSLIIFGLIIMALTGAMGNTDILYPFAGLCHICFL